MRRLLAVWLVGVLATLMLGACGGGDDKGADDVDAATAADDGDKGSDDEAEDDASDDSSDDGDDGPGVGVFSAARCSEAIQAYSAGAAAASLAMSGDTKAMKASIEKMDDFADDAPREIRDDLQKLGEAWTGYANGIADAGWNPASGKAPTEEQSKKLDAAAALFEEADYKAAQENIDAWFDSGCSG